MSIRVYNTLTQTKEQFEPVNPPKVGIYVCGPTVYKPSHIGHAVGPIIFDAVKRYLTYRCLLYTSPSPRDRTRSRMPSSA